MQKPTKRTAKSGAKDSPKSKQHGIRISDATLLGEIEAAAKERGWAISDLYREAVKEYLGKDRIREELAEFEKRIAGSHRAVTKEQRRIGNQLDVMLALFDLFARSYFMHTPSVPPEAVELASAEGWQRYEKMRNQVAQMVRSTSGVLAVAAELNAEDDPE